MLGYRLWHATRHYLRLPHAAAIAASYSLIAGLIWLYIVLLPGYLLR